MDLSFLLEYVNLVTLGICLCVGYVIKHSITVIDNKYIPLIMLVTGTLISVACNFQNITAATILSGMFSGLASTGLHEAFRVQLKKTVDTGEDGNGGN